MRGGEGRGGEREGWRGREARTGGEGMEEVFAGKCNKETQKRRTSAINRTGVEGGS